MEYLHWLFVHAVFRRCSFNILCYDVSVTIEAFKNPRCVCTFCHSRVPHCPFVRISRCVWSPPHLYMGQAAHSSYQEVSSLAPPASNFSTCAAPYINTADTSQLLASRDSQRAPPLWKGPYIHRATVYGWGCWSISKCLCVFSNWLYPCRVCPFL